MTFQPFGELVLVEKLEGEKETPTGIIMPDSHQNRFWKVRILETGPDTHDDIRAGYICMANPIPEIDNEKAFENKNYKLMHQKNILGRYI